MELTMLHRTLLFDTYGETLTEKQKTCLDLRYNQDLSLGEIGELEGISRQAVRDNIVRAEAQMLELEEKIGAVRRALWLEETAEDLKAIASELQTLGPRGEALSQRILSAAKRIEE